MSSHCAFWVASEKYWEEAGKSAERFHSIMPDIETHLVLLHDDSKVYWYLQNVREIEKFLSTMCHTDAIYFDTDTYLVEPVYELFHMLEEGFDVLGVHAPGRITAKTVKAIPDSFPEINIGVCGFSNTVYVRDMVRNWRIRFEMNLDIYGNNDQPSLREELWNNRNIRLGVLPPEYNCRFRFGAFLRYPAKILHGRYSDMDALAKSINKQKGTRVWTLNDMK